MSENKKRLIVIGGDAAGMSVAVRAKKHMQDLEVVVLERSPHISYAACGMPYMISGVIPDPASLLILTPEKALSSRGVNVRTGHEVVSIDLGQKLVACRSENQTGTGEETFGYDALVLATGARARIPAVSGVNLEGVTTLRTYQDGLALKNFLEENSVKKVVITGSGLVGLETAESFRRLDCNVTLLKRSAGPLLGLEPVLSKIVEEELARNGCILLKNSPLEEIVKNGRGGVAAVRTDGETIKADLVLLATGVIPNSEIAAAAGIRLSVQNTIAVNEHLETSADSVFAAGDCTSQIHRVSEKPVFISQALAANRSGRTAGANVAAMLSGRGKPGSYPGTMGTVLTKVFDLEVGLCGLNPEGAAAAGFDARFAWIKDRSRAGYYPGGSSLYVGLVFESRSGRLLGGQIIGKEGAAKRLDVISAAIDAKMDLERFSNLDLGYCPPFSPAWDPLLTAASVALKNLE